MRKMWIVALREYRVTIHTKTFVIAMVLMPVFMGGSIAIQVLLEGRVDRDTKRIAVIDRSGKMFATLAQAVKDRNEQMTDSKTSKAGGPRWELIEVPPCGTDPNRQLLDLSQQVRDKKLFAFLEIAPDILQSKGAESAPAAKEDDARPEPLRVGRISGVARPSPTAMFAHGGEKPRAPVRYFSNQPTYFDIGIWLQRIISGRVQEVRLIEAHIDPALVRQASEEVGVDNLGLVTTDASGQIKPAEEVNMGLAFGVPFALTMLMFMALAMTTQPLLNGVLEEKMARIAEVLLGSVPPFQLMLGKLIGYVGVAVTLVAVYLAGGFFVANYFGLTDVISTSLLVWFMVFLCLSILMFGSMFLAIGACCNDIREAQNLMLPLWLILCIPLLTLQLVIQHPDSLFSTLLSLFPPATPMLMVPRMAVPPGVPLWQPVVGIIGTLLTTLLCVWTAGRIFRIGLLLQGKPPKVREMLRWAVRG